MFLTDGAAYALGRINSDCWYVADVCGLMYIFHVCWNDDKC